jgi:hypothetical protein
MGALRDASEFFIVEGTNDIDLRRSRDHGKGRALGLRRVVPHQNFVAQRGENDIALLELASPARATAVALADSSHRTLEAAGKSVVITGWGTMRPMKKLHGLDVDFQTERPVRFGDPVYYTDRLMEIEIPLVDEANCQEANAVALKGTAAMVIDARTICAGLEEGGKDSCKGDSGGPVVARDDRGRFVQVGIVSWGIACGLGNGYGVNTRVSAFETWIRSTAGLRPAVPVTPPRPAAPAPPPPPPMPAAAVAQDALARDNPSGLAVEIVQGDTLRIGQAVQFRVTAQKPGHLLLLDLTPDGTLTQIFPNTRSLATPLGGSKDANLVEPGRDLLVPDLRTPYAGFEMKVEPPAGKGLLVAVLSERPLRSVPIPDLPKAMDRMDAVDFISGLANELERDLVVQGPARAPGWSVVMRPYRVDR